MADRFYHRGISRMKAEEILLKQPTNGRYLVRDSETTPGAFTLCLLKDRTIKQYRILPDKQHNLYVQAESGVEIKKHPDLATLINSYTKQGDSNGLVCALSHPVHSQQTIESEDEDDEDEPLTSVEASCDHTLLKNSEHIQQWYTHQADASSSAQQAWQKAPPSHLDALKLNCPPTQQSSSSSHSHIHPHPFPTGTQAGNKPFIDTKQDTLQSTLRVAKDTSSTQPSSTLGVDKEKSRSSLQKYFESRLHSIDLSNLDGNFQQLLQDYVQHKVTLDAAQSLKSQPDYTTSQITPQHLESLLKEAFRPVQLAVDSFMLKLDVLRELFAPLKHDKLLARFGECPSDPNTSACDRVCDVAQKLENLKAPVENVHAKANSQFRQLDQDKQNSSASTLSRTPPKSQPIPDVNYKVKYLRQGRFKLEMTLTVNVKDGKLLAVKPNNSKLTDNNTFSHQKVQKLVKHSKNSVILEIHVQGHKAKSYEFESMRARESFCQMIHEMKRKHSTNTELDNLSLFVGTFNLGESGLPNFNQLPKWLQCTGTGTSRDTHLASVAFDMYVIGIQEKERTLGIDDLAQEIKKCLKIICPEETFVLLTSKQLWQIGMVVFVKAKHKDKIHHVETSSKPTGIANKLGNKGAVGISMYINETSLCFVCAHLAARQDASRNERRNQNFRDIIKGLNLSNKRLGGVIDLSQQFHHVFFLGDLNYRIDDKNTQPLIENIRSENYKDLLKQDQLKLVQQEGKAFVDFKEGDIMFPPTYRMKRGVKQEYVVEKKKSSGIRINTPSWCDRVLWRSYPGLYIVNDTYGSVEDVLSSDHKPVFASYTVGIALTRGALNTRDNSAAPEAKIVFEKVSAKVKMNNKEPLTLELHSDWLDKVVSSKPNKNYDDYEEGYCSPRWDSSDIDKVSPPIGDVLYLEEQHLILVVKSEETMESYGEAVISMKDKCTSNTIQFNLRLTHLGEETGSIQGTMHMEKLKDPTRQRRLKDYECVFMDHDIYGETLPRSQQMTSPLTGSGVRSHPMASSLTGSGVLYSEAITDEGQARKAAQQISAMDMYDVTYDGSSHGNQRTSENRKSHPVEDTVVRGNQTKPSKTWSKGHKPDISSVYEVHPDQTIPLALETKKTRARRMDYENSSFIAKNKPDPSGKDATSIQSQRTNQNAVYSSVGGARNDAKPINASLPPKPQPRLDIKGNALSSDAKQNKGGSHATEKSGPNIPSKCGAAGKPFYHNPDVNREKSGDQHDDRQHATANQRPSRAHDPSVHSMVSALEENPMYGVNPAQHRPVVADEIYETLDAPSSVRCWLRGLDLSQYLSNFIDNGFDKLQALPTLCAQDLREIGIKNETHQTRILTSIKHMKKSSRK